MPPQSLVQNVSVASVLDPGRQSAVTQNADQGSSKSGAISRFKQQSGIAMTNQLAMTTDI
jgi:hypothetical protein